jgi:hypothetical protein
LFGHAASARRPWLARQSFGSHARTPAPRTVQIIYHESNWLNMLWGYYK